MQEHDNSIISPANHNVKGGGQRMIDKSDESVADVKIRSFRGRIVAKIPYDKRHRVQELKIGWFESKWKCWAFPYSPVAAHFLIEEFRNELAYCEQEIAELDKHFQQAHQDKYAENPPPIPGLSNHAPTTWEHQRQACRFGCKLPGVLFDMWMGTGKTLTAYGVLANVKNDRVLVICPKSVIPVWWYEAKKVERNFLVTLLNKGTTRNKAALVNENMELARCESRPHVVVVNYETFWREPLFDKQIMSRDWDVVIYDEIHRLKDPTGRASKAAAKLRDKASLRLGLTGTPMPHDPTDIFGIYRALDTSVFGTNYHRFKMRYCVFGGYATKEVVDYKNREDLNYRFRLIAYQAPSDVIDLPGAIHTYRTVPLEKKAQKLYNDLDKALYAEVEEGSITPANAMVKVLRLQQLTSGYMSTDEDELVEVGTEKKELLKDLLQDIPRDEPVVVFTRFKPDLSNVLEVAKEVGRSCAEHSGRKHQLAEWQNGDYNVLATQINSGKEGVDLSRAAYCIYYSIGHSLGDYEQSLSRTRRPGQTRTVQYFHLLTEDTIDLTIYKSLRKRREVIDTILAGERATMDEVAEIDATEGVDESEMN